MSTERTPFFAIAGLAGMLSINPVQASVVLSEVLYDSAGSDNGNAFVELFGTPGALLDGLLLEGVNGSDGSVYRSITLAGLIPADGVYVIGDDSGDGTTLVANTDFVAAVDFQNGPDSIVLRDTGGILDALGYGDFTGIVFAGEGSAAPDVPSGSSLARSSPQGDTDNNLVDFIALDLPTPGSVPGSAPVSAVPLPASLWLFMTGIVGLFTTGRRLGSKRVAQND